MAIQGVDYSTARPGGAALRAAGKEFAVRYVPYGGVRKALGSAERDDLLRHGISIAMVYESWAGRALDGREAGRADAEQSSSQLRALGFPATTPVYFAVDFDASAGQQPPIDGYLRGAAEVIGAGRVGVYGGYHVIKRCHDNGTARWLWQTYAWSGGNVHPDLHLYQYRNASNLSGSGPGDVDLNEARRSDFGQWKAHGPIPTPGPTWEQMWDIVHTRFPTLRLTSGYRRINPDTGQPDTGYHGRGKAIDFAGPIPDPDGNPLMTEVVRWIAVTYPDSTELIHTPAGPAYQLKNGEAHVYSAATANDHRDHAHWAYDVADLPGSLQEDEKMTPQQYDAMMAQFKWLSDRIKGVLPESGYVLDESGRAREVALGAPGSHPVGVLNTLHGNAIMLEVRAGNSAQAAKFAEVLAKRPADITDEDVAAIAAVIPDGVAKRVADELAARLPA